MTITGCTSYIQCKHYQQNIINNSSMGGSESKPGYRIIEIMKDSPADDKGFLPYLDFITSFNGTNILESTLPFQELIKSNIDCPITLGIFSLKDMNAREVQITPQTWQGEGLLGLSLRYEDASEALHNIIHVTKVFPDSPASQAGLLEGEYIIGSSEIKIKDVGDMQLYLETKKEINLAVFNKTDSSVHFLTLKSSDGSIGMEVATGVMHRLNSE